jgi:hypothetical protein
MIHVAPTGTIARAGVPSGIEPIRAIRARVAMLSRERAIVQSAGIPGCAA